MGKLYDLKEAIATKLEANVAELADVDVIAHHGRDCQQRVQAGLSKASGLAVMVALTGGDDDQAEKRVCGMGLRLNSILSVTVWSTPILVRHASTAAPLTTGTREPDDVLEAIIKYLHNLDVSDVGDLLEGGPGTLRVNGWGLIPTDPPFLVHEIQGEIVTQLDLHA